MAVAPKRRRTKAPSVQRGANRILSALPREAYATLAPHLVRVSLASGQVLQKPRGRVTTVYFPETSVLSVIARMEGNVAVEVGTVGHEGFVGLSVLFGVSTSPTQCLAQVPGEALAIAATTFRTLLSKSTALRDVLLRYAQVYMHQVGQRVACSSVHNVAERCARWILAADDTAGTGTPTGGTFQLTQEYLAYMLGVRREGVSAAARVLRTAGLIEFSRGRISVTDRAGLESASCACYESVALEYCRVLGIESRAPERSARQRTQLLPEDTITN